MSVKNEEENYIKVSVPATTANMGPGFDTIGMAFKKYNEFWVQEIDKGLVIESNGGLYHNTGDIRHNRDNLMFTSMCKFYMETGAGIIPPLKILHRDNIPMTRGLGSSATCITAGLLLANELSGQNVSINDICSMATMLEGHPDNVLPSILGGVVVGAMNGSDGKSVSYIRLNTPNIEKLKVAVLIPSFHLSTRMARNVLPKNYSVKDVVYNVSRSSLLVASIASGDFSNLKTAFEDKVHQPYRMSLIPSMEEIFDTCKKAGAIGSFLSGAGPTLISVVEDEISESFMENIKKYLLTLEKDWSIEYLEPDFEGAKVTIVNNID